VVSRSALFDDFATAWPIVITQSLSAEIVIGSGDSVAPDCRESPRRGLWHITAQIIPSKGAAVDRLGKLLDEAKNLNDGAFTPKDQPAGGQGRSAADSVLWRHGTAARFHLARKLTPLIAGA
jgi:hypothetical protein